MCGLSRVSKIIFTLYLAVVVSACVPMPDYLPDNNYSPGSSSQVKTKDEAISDLSSMLKDSSVYFVSGKNDLSVCGTMSADSLLKLHITSYGHFEDGSGCFYYINTVNVTSDSIDFPLFPLQYEDLLGFQIVASGGGILLPYGRRVYPGDVYGDSARKMADDLYFIQVGMGKSKEERLVAFKEMASKYRELKSKPVISEEQRKYIVQANALSQKKDYAGAISRYKKAIEIDPASYTAAYFNMALLYSQEEKFKSAIEYMEKYLIIEPDAKDARSAQDKIYEWEVMLQK